MTHPTPPAPVVTASRSAVQAGTRAAAVAGAAVQEHSRNWMENFARLGYAAKGALYLLVGLLALQAAIGWGGQVGDSRSALATLQGRWAIGTILLWAIAAGLAGYALWNLLRAAWDPEGEGKDPKGIAKRVYFGISGLIHASLAFWVFRHLLVGAGSGGEASGTQDAVGRALEWGIAGRVGIALVGGAIVGYGVQQLVSAWKVDLSDQLELSSMSPATRRATIFTGRLGMAARGIVFVIVGWFFIQAAWYAAQGEAGGLGDALTTVSSFGWIVLGVVAFGLAAYGIHMFITARFRRIQTH